MAPAGRSRAVGAWGHHSITPFPHSPILPFPHSPALPVTPSSLNPQPTLNTHRRDAGAHKRRRDL